MVFVLAMGWQRHTFRASLSLYLLFVMTGATIGYAVTGAFTTERIVLVAIAIWPILIGFGLATASPDA